MEIIKDKFIELIALYEENASAIDDEQFKMIMNYLKYIFMTNNENIKTTKDAGLTQTFFYEKEVTLDITQRFTPMHLTGSFTYCTGTLSIGSLFFDFYLYEYNTYTRDYNEIEKSKNLSFCYFDTNNKDYAYFNIFKPNEYEMFTIGKYRNIEDFLEMPIFKIKTIIFYKNN